MRKQITEYLDIDLHSEMWICRRCEYQLISAHENYKKGCLVYDRNPHEIHPPEIEGAYTFSPDPGWIRYVEFYCPQCGTLIETEVLPPGHPITHDLELDIQKLKEKYLSSKEE
jgi:acetophenone carboxylase